MNAYYEALARLDVDAFEALHHPDVVYNVSGNTIISGRYNSFAALKTILPLIFEALDFERFQFAKNWKIMTEGHDSITAIMEAEGVARNGKRYDQRYAHIFAFRDGKITSVHEFFDTQLANESLEFTDKDPCQTDGEFTL
ncbi:nuclear transport factor 2 family protein [Parasphingorhabdus cellanae]|uniref:Nuclear transport factor 2 family protein n=1 Tax=Parasphingorhabdus cellanae TaxID=2806553 RepID=A0ABX7T4D6_9SPHN|nr:nuclear transport factor 2 family protein [Parasphingorhabdus cellanae]QTD55364.1 nuclear transport factor 2 family protein [Parasphingorhabdus cellanae]